MEDGEDKEDMGNERGFPGKAKPFPLLVVLPVFYVLHVFPVLSFLPLPHLFSFLSRSSPKKANNEKKQVLHISAQMVDRYIEKV
jgi:hypothetical protein